MPLEFNCPMCKAALRVKDEHAGKKMKCPKCAKVVSIPAAEEEVIEEVDVVEDEAAAPAGAGSPFAFEGDEAPPAKQGAPQRLAPERPRGKTWGKYMPCPNCRGREARRVMWTWWGSFYGPKLFTHVRCIDCGTSFNGKSGDTNVIPAVLIPSTCLVLIVGLCIFIYVTLVRTGNWPPWVRFVAPS